jgi:transposase
VSDEEWAFVAPYLKLMIPDAPQRHYHLREVFNALRWIVRAGTARRRRATDVPPSPTVFQQSRRRLERHGSAERRGLIVDGLLRSWFSAVAWAATRARRSEALGDKWRYWLGGV